jgi:hypothetical protein
MPEAGVYYFDPSTGEKLGSTSPPHYATPNPSMFTISEPYSAIKGMAVNAFTLGSAEKSPPGANALAIAYVTSNRCSSANTEYGFFRDLVTPGQPVFAYYSDKTNCSPDGECRSANDFRSPPVIQKTSPFTKFANIKNYDGDSQNIFYSLYFIKSEQSPTVKISSSGYVLRYAILDGVHTDRFATCNVNDSPTAGDCMLDVPVESWYPVAKMITGNSFAVIGTWTSYPIAPVFAPGPTGFTVGSLNLGR